MKKVINKSFDILSIILVVVLFGYLGALISAHEYGNEFGNEGTFKTIAAFMTLGGFICYIHILTIQIKKQQNTPSIKKTDLDFLKEGYEISNIKTHEITIGGKTYIAPVEEGDDPGWIKPKGRTLPWKLKLISIDQIPVHQCFEKGKLIYS